MKTLSVSLNARVLAGAALLSVCLTCLPSQAAHRIEVGQPAPDFSGNTFDKRKLSLADFKGKVLVVNLWATWCGPCRKELPTLDYFALRMKDYGFEVVAVATEDSVPPYQLKELSQKVHFPFLRSLRGRYDILTGVPTNYVIDRNGIVRYAAAGAFDLGSLASVVMPLLYQNPP